MTDMATDQQQSTFQKSKVIGPIVATGAVIVVGLAVYLSEGAPEGATQTIYEDVPGARPTGAGTMPDGTADMLREGMGNGTVADDVLDQTQTTDTLSPLLEGGDASPTPARTADGLEPIDPAQGDIVEQIEDASGMQIELDAPTAP